MLSQGCKGRWVRTDRCLIDVHGDIVEGGRRSTSERDGPGVGAAPWAGRERPAAQAVWPRCRDKQTGGALDRTRYEDLRLIDHRHIVGDGVAKTTGAESPAYRATTLNQRRPTRAKSAPVQARIVRSQRFTAISQRCTAAATNLPNPAQPCGKRLRKAKNPGAGKRRDFSPGGFSRPVHSTALPPFHRKREG